MKSTIIQDEACIETTVKVSPDVKIKFIQTGFVGEPVVEACAENAPECSYEVSQLICVKYSLDFSADVQASPAGIICNPQLQECSEQAAFSDDQEAPAEAAYEPEVQERSEQADFSDVQEVQEEIAYEPEIQKRPEQKVPTEYTHTKVRPSLIDRIDDRKISMSTNLYEKVFLPLRYRKH